MKKPKEAIERINKIRPYIDEDSRESLDLILVYFNSLPDWIGEWPADLTRERLEELADCEVSLSSRARWAALRALAAIAPQRKKRLVNLWTHRDCCDVVRGFELGKNPNDDTGSNPWRKVNTNGPVEIDD